MFCDPSKSTLATLVNPVFLSPAAHEKLAHIQINNDHTYTFLNTHFKRIQQIRIKRIVFMRHTKSAHTNKYFMSLVCKHVI